MKVLQFITSVDRKNGGTSTYLELLTEYLGRLVDLHIASVPCDNPVNLRQATMHHVDCVGMKNLPRLRCQVAALLDELRPDIVHSNGIWEPQSYIVQREAQRRGIKFLITPHGMMEPWCVHHKAWKKRLALALYQRRSIREADCLHATTERERDNMLLWGEKTPVAVIPLGIGVDEIAVKDSWKKRRKVLFLSRIHMKKGIEFILEAIRELKANLSGYTFVVAGEGEPAYVEGLKQRARQYGIDTLVDFVGGVYGDRKYDLYRDCDFFVLPTYAENFGYVIAEALAVGTPVVTTHETPWQSLEEQRCGRWVPLRQADITSAMADMLAKSDEELETMGRNARRLIETQCNSATVARRTVELYQQLLSNPCKKR